MPSKAQREELNERARELGYEYAEMGFEEGDISLYELLALARYTAELEVALRLNMEALVSMRGTRQEAELLRQAWEDGEMLAFAKGDYDPDAPD